MAQYQDIQDLDQLSEAELRAAVRERLEGNDTLDIDELTIRVENGTVVIGGSVESDEEWRVADHVMSDVLAIPLYRNELVIELLRRTDDASEEDAVDSGSATQSMPDGAIAAAPGADEDPNVEAAELYGTTDAHVASEEATPWTPPDAPTPEGPISADLSDEGEDA